MRGPLKGPSDLVNRGSGDRGTGLPPPASTVPLWPAPLPPPPGRATRRPGSPIPRSGCDLGPPDVVDDVLHGLEVLELLVGYFNTELVLGGNSDLDHGQAVDIEVIYEGLLGRHLVGWYACDRVDDFA